MLTMLRIHFMQQWFVLPDSGIEKAFFNTPLYREFAQLEELTGLPDGSTILRFRHWLEKHKFREQMLHAGYGRPIQRGLLLTAGTAVDATLIAAPTSTKNKDRTLDPEMHFIKKGMQWYLGTKVHIGVDADSGLVHTVRGTSIYISDIAKVNTLLHGLNKVSFGDADCQGIENRPDAETGASWHVAMRPGKRKALGKKHDACALIDQAQKLRAGVRAKVEYPFRVIERQFGSVKVRYRGLKKNTARLFTLFALSNLWMVRSKLMVTGHGVRAKTGQVPCQGQRRLTKAEKCQGIRGVLVKFHYLKINDLLLELAPSCSDHPKQVNARLGRSDRIG